jgi:hypothetical protein
VLQKLASHNGDIKRLIEKGYALSTDSHYLIVRDVPYLDAERKLQWGSLVTKVLFVDQDHIRPEDHQIFFAGSVPHNLDGTPIPNLGGGATPLTLGEGSKDVIVERSFSHLPFRTKKYEDFFDKIDTYVTVISGPAMHLHGANPYTFKTVENAPNSVFKFHDTLTSRAEIGDLAAKFQNDIIAIIGVGGTGSYILDLIVRTPVKEIRIFDKDLFYVHNAFRSPGQTRESEFNKPKVQIYKARYDDYRHGVRAEQQFVDATSTTDFEGVTFAFVCVDKGSSRSGIFDLLIAKEIPFIDVGMGLDRNKVDNSLTGMLRTTYFSAQDAQTIRDMRLADVSDDPNDIYRNNIQLGELNALNASLAVIKFKQLRGFYSSEPGSSFHFLLDIEDLKIVQ